MIDKCKLCNSDLDIRDSMLFNRIYNIYKIKGFLSQRNCCSSYPGHFCSILDSEKNYYYVGRGFLNNKKNMYEFCYSSVEGKTKIYIYNLDHFENVSFNSLETFDEELEFREQLIETILTFR